jgi:hypothetical protein
MTRWSPGASIVDDRAGANRELLLREPVAHDGSGDPVPLERQRGHAGVVEDRGARGGGGDHVRERQPRVVRGGIVIRRAARETLPPEARLGGEHPRCAQRAVPRDVTEQREQVVHPEPGIQLPSRDARAPVHGPGELEWPDEVRRDLEEDPALAARLEHEVEEPMLEVSHAAMDQLRRPVRRAAREVVPVHERHGKAAQRGVARDPGAVDAAADDEHVEAFAREPRARRFPPPGKGVDVRGLHRAKT